MKILLGQKYIYVMVIKVLKNSTFFMQKINFWLTKDLVGDTIDTKAEKFFGYTLLSDIPEEITTTYEEETKTIVFIYTKNLPPKEEGIVPPQTGLDGIKYYGIYSIKYLVLLILVAARLKFKRA